MPVELFGQVAIGAAGAPTISVANSKGIRSIARTGAGAYTITLQDSYVRLLFVGAVFVNSTAPASPSVYVVSSDVTNATTPTVLVQFTDLAGVATDPGNGEVLLLDISLSNSTAP